MSYKDRILEYQKKVKSERVSDYIKEVLGRIYFDSPQLGQYIAGTFNSGKLFTENTAADSHLAIDNNFFRDFEEKHHIDKGYAFMELSYFPKFELEGRCLKGAKYLDEICLPDNLTEIPSCFLMINHERTTPLVFSDQERDKKIRLRWFDDHDLVIEIPGFCSAAPIMMMDNGGREATECQEKYGAQTNLHLSQSISDSLKLGLLFDTKQHSTTFEIKYLPDDYVLDLYMKGKDGKSFLSDFYDSLKLFILFSIFSAKLFTIISSLFVLDDQKFKTITQKCGLDAIISDDDSKYFVIDCTLLYCTLLYFSPFKSKADQIDFDKTFLYRYKDVQILQFFQPEKVEAFLKQIYDEVEYLIEIKC